METNTITKATKAAKAKTRRKLQMRAWSVITSKTIDTDTKNAILEALTNNSADLEELVTRALAGETIWDLSADPQADLAQAISRVLRHPLTPVALYDAIAVELMSMTNAIDFDAPEMIERTLNAHASRERGGQR